MANDSDGSAVYEVRVGEDDYIDGLDVTESDGSITTYLFRPANYDEVEAARKRAESAASLASSAADAANIQAGNANAAARTVSSRRCSPMRRESLSIWTVRSTAQPPRRRYPGTRCRSAARARSRAAR